MPIGTSVNMRNAIAISIGVIVENLGETLELAPGPLGP